MADFNDDLFLSGHALRRYATEADNGPWYAVFGRTGGRLITTHKDQVWTPEPEAVQRLFTDDMAAALNQELAHDGAWVVLLTSPIMEEGGLVVSAEREYGRFCFIWMDKDGDIQFTIENEEPLWVVLAQQKLHWMEQAEQAWQAWYFHMREVLAPSDDQLGTRVN